MKAKNPTSSMYSPDLFQPKNRINVFSVETGNWVGHIIRNKNNQFAATKTSGASETFMDEESARRFLQNMPAPILFEEHPTQEIINPKQVNLFL